MAANWAAADFYFSSQNSQSQAQSAKEAVFFSRLTFFRATDRSSILSTAQIGDSFAKSKLQKSSGHWIGFFIPNLSLCSRFLIQHPFRRSSILEFCQWHNRSLDRKVSRNWVEKSHLQQILLLAFCISLLVFSHFALCLWSMVNGHFLN